MLDKQQWTMRDSLTVAFGLLMVAGTFYLTFSISQSILGLPWSGLIGTAAGVGALKMLSGSPQFQAIDRRFRQREEQRERASEDRRMRKALKKVGLLR